MLYLNGASGTTCIYIHLNNDLTAKNDNRGRCVAGTAYWKGLKDGALVDAGQPIAYNGNWVTPTRPATCTSKCIPATEQRSARTATCARRWLLFAIQPGADFTAALRGNVVKADAAARSLTMMVDRVQSWRWAPRDRSQATGRARCRRARSSPIRSVRSPRPRRWRR